MYDIYATDLVMEQCEANKQEIDIMVPYAVLHFVLSGEGYINGNKITSNMAFINFEDSRMCYYPSKSDPWSYIYLRLDGSEIKKAFLDHGFNLDLTICKFHDQRALFNILELYSSLADVDNADFRRMIANMIFLLFEDRGKAQKIKGRQEQNAEQIKTYIDQNYYKKITVESIASKFYLNKNYVRSLFVKHLGISPKQYIQKVRMDRAGFLLSTTNEDVKLIANSVGYDDSLLFSKMFKVYYGVSPSQYRSQSEK